MNEHTPLHPNPAVTCVIVNWNRARDTVECLTALKQSTYRNLTTVLVDNGSRDDSVARVRAAHPDVAVIEAGNNLGYAGGNNLGIRHALAGNADYVWLLNNDTRPDRDALSKLVAKAQTDRRLGAVASICYYADTPSAVQIWAGGRVNLLIGYIHNSTAPREDGWFHSLNGTSMLIARRAIEDVGLLDEGFFLYWEDTEFCLRLRKTGWRLAAAPESRILHQVSASTGGNRKVVDRYLTASGLRLLRLHSPVPRLSQFLFLAMRLSRRVATLQFARCKSVWAGLRDYQKMLPVVGNTIAQAHYSPRTNGD